MPAIDQKELQARLKEYAHDGDVPGASVAVLHRGSLIGEAATGVINRRTGVPATTDTLYQIGSITKLWTATLVFQLIDEGLVDLDEPVRTYLPGFRVADHEASAAITIRHLLTHQSGFDGEKFFDTGRGDDAIARYVALLADVRQVIPVGSYLSYNNAGWVVLGRLLEVFRKKPYLQLVTERLYEPLGLSSAVTLPEQALLYSAAVGHQPDADGIQRPAGVWNLPHSCASTGALLTMTAADLARFGGLYLADGVAPDGTRLMSPEIVAASQEPQIEVPFPGFLGDHWGLGFEIFNWSGQRIIGHDGGTIGQKAFLRLSMDKDLSVALLTNGGNPYPLYRQVLGWIFAQVADITINPLPMAPQPPLPVQRDLIEGIYQSSLVRITVTVDEDGRAWARTEERGGFGLAPMHHELLAVGEGRYLTADSPTDQVMPHVFVDSDGDGRADFVHIGVAVARIED